MTWMCKWSQPAGPAPASWAPQKQELPLVAGVFAEKVAFEAAVVGLPHSWVLGSPAPAALRDATRPLPIGGRGRVRRSRLYWPAAALVSMRCVLTFTTRN